MFEDVEAQHHNCLLALASEVEMFNAKLVEYEDRERWVNLHIYGFPEHAKEKNAKSFLKDILPEILHAHFPGGLDLGTQEVGAN